MRGIAIGMSGGVDSSFAAYLLRQQGYKVLGVSLILWDTDQPGYASCCSSRSVEDAAHTAGLLDIEHMFLDVKASFEKLVIEPFVREYISGSTPNPCILCNRNIKFPSLLSVAEEKGIEHIGTGHYARVEHKEFNVHTSSKSGKKDKERRRILKKGTDLKKDQSYVLYALGQHELRRLLLPLGNQLKEDVKRNAEKLHLPAAGRPESQEICFIADRNYTHFIKKYVGNIDAQGPILDLQGNMLGMHQGIHKYTLGQRKRLGISSREPFYVVKIDAAKNALYVGCAEEAKQKRFSVSMINWIVPPSSRSFRATVKVRSTMPDEPATLSLEAGEKRSLTVDFDTPQWAPAPGQSAVFYNGDTILGGGIIQA